MSPDRYRRKFSSDAWTSWAKNRHETRGDGWWHSPRWPKGSPSIEHSLWVDGILKEGILALEPSGSYHAEPYPRSSLPVPIVSGVKKDANGLFRAVEDTVACYVGARDGRFKKNIAKLAQHTLSLEAVGRHLAGSAWDWVQEDEEIVGQIEFKADGTFTAFDATSKWTVEFNRDTASFAKDCKIAISHPSTQWRACTVAETRKREGPWTLLPLLCI